MANYESMNGKTIGVLVNTVLLNKEIHKATKFITPRLICKATYRGSRYKYRNENSHNIVVTIGEPNYEEQRFIKNCKKANVKFPVKKIQLKMEKENGYKNKSVRRTSRRRKNKQT